MRIDPEFLRALGSAIAVLLVGSMFCFGCKSVDYSNSGTAEFPAVERWWK